MKVYLVITYDYDGMTIEGAFSDEAMAEEYAPIVARIRRERAENIGVEQLEVDAIVPWLRSPESRRWAVIILKDGSIDSIWEQLPAQTQEEDRDRPRRVRRNGILQEALEIHVYAPDEERAKAIARERYTGSDSA